MDHCANRKDTWINDEIKKAYTQLHLDGAAHSLEVWCDAQLVGGLYGVSIGSAFFAESKFHTATDASKAALFFLVEHMKKLRMELSRNSIHDRSSKKALEPFILTHLIMIFY